MDNLNIKNSTSEIQNTTNETVNELNNEQKLNTRTVNTPPDGGWGWVIVFACFLVNVIVDGLIFSYGVFTPEFIKYFGLSRSTVGYMGSLIIAITCCTGPLANYFANKTSYRFVAMFGAVLGSLGFAIPYFFNNLWVLVLFSSIISPIGFGLMYLPSISIINMWFDKKKSLALSITICGSGLGTFFCSPLLEFLISSYGWQMTMLIISIYLLISIFCILTFKNRETNEDNENISNKENIDVVNNTENLARIPSIINNKVSPYSDFVSEKVTENFLNENNETLEIKSSIFSFLTNPLLIIFIISNILTSISVETPCMFVKDRALLDGITSSKASHLISAIGIGNLIGRLGFGYLTTFRWVNRFHLYNLTLIGSGLVLIVSWIIKTYPLMIICYCIYGILSGPYLTMTPVILVDLFGSKNFDNTLSIILVSQGLSVFVGPPFSGFIYDESLSYNLTFMVCGLLMASSGLIMYFCYIFQNFRKVKFNI